LGRKENGYEAEEEEFQIGPYSQDFLMSEMANPERELSADTGSMASAMGNSPALVSENSTERNEWQCDY
jgi:hypothetical protein